MKSFPAICAFLSSGKFSNLPAIRIDNHNNGFHRENIYSDKFHTFDSLLSLSSMKNSNFIFSNSISLVAERKHWRNVSSFWICELNAREFKMVLRQRRKASSKSVRYPASERLKMRQASLSLSPREGPEFMSQDKCYL